VRPEKGPPDIGESFNLFIELPFEFLAIEGFRGVKFASVWRAKSNFQWLVCDSIAPVYLCKSSSVYCCHNNSINKASPSGLAYLWA